jgi:hypothetical protein
MMNFIVILNLLVQFWQDNQTIHFIMPTFRKQDNL